jgi:putative Mg2+ transporter-C (MgtC) family protein
MIISKYAFEGAADSARVAAQIVAGVGFLGAGMIVYKKREITGLTTAAGIWATAGVGMACGGRLYLVAVGATIIIVLIQYLLHLNVKLFRHKSYNLLKIEFYSNNDEHLKIKQIFSVDKFNDLFICKDGENIKYFVTINTKKEFGSKELNEVIKNEPYIISIERIDAE